MKNPMEALKKRLEGKNLSDVARRAGMARDNVCRIAKGEAPDAYVSTVITLNRVLDDMERYHEGT